MNKGTLIRNGVNYSGGSSASVENVLTSSSTSNALSANMGRVLKEIVSDEWNSATTYAIGDYCISGNTLYRCIQQNQNVAPPNATYWEATSVADELSRYEEKWDLLNDTTYAIQTANVERVVTIPNLSKYSEICVTISAGDGMGTTNAIIKRIPNRTSYFTCQNVGSDINWRASVRLNVDFQRNTIGIIGYTANWSLTTCNFVYVWGVKLA